MINSDNYTLADFGELSDKDIFAKTGPSLEYIDDYKRKGYYIYQKVLATPCENRVNIVEEKSGKPREVIMMGSNNYLGLTTHPKVVAAAIRACEEFGTGSGGAALLSGTTEIHRRLEKRLAMFLGCEDAVVFPNGYSTNVGTLSALAGKGDLIISDMLNHTSIVDGCRLSEGDYRVYRHRDMSHLENILRRSCDKYAGKLIVTDGVFSMDGDICPLPEIMELARKYNARVMIDEAHAIGVIGNNGRGTCDYFDMIGEVDIIMGTLSKALAGVGGFVASSRDVVNHLRHFAHSYFFSSNLPPSVEASALAALDVIEEEPQMIIKLKKNAVYMHSHLRGMGYNLPDVYTPILPVFIGKELTLRKMGKRFNELGLYISPIPYPAVPKNKARFRVCLMATHRKQDMDDALTIMEQVGKEFGII